MCHPLFKAEGCDGVRVALRKGGTAMATLDLWIDGIEPALSVRRFDVREALSEPFSISIIACSPRPDIDLDEVILKPASFAICAGWAHVRNNGTRIYSGLCTFIEQIQAEPTGLSTYAIRIAPRFWLLTLRHNYRIFQHATAPEVATRILNEFSIKHEWRIDQAVFPKLEFKVQYGESDYAFMCRVFEEAGLTFTFEETEAGSSLLVISDAPCACTPRDSPPLQYADNPNEAAEREFITRIRIFREGRAGVVTMRDYDFRNPLLPLFARVSGANPLEARIEHYRYEPGAFRIDTSIRGSTPVADTHGAARHDPQYGHRRTDRILAGDQIGASGIAFETNAMDLSPGTLFSVTGHPHPRLDEKSRLLTTELILEGERDKAWSTRGKATFADREYRPARKTRKPTVIGFQSAIVTGPKGREIYTDEFGRVRVQFPWDREGESHERSSCWIRVSQGWAGAGFGMITIPRVGQEVLIGFIEGDPDQPIVVGRAINALNPPPYPLPGNETKTVLRSQTSPGSDGFNEITFEDLRGEELVYQRAQRDRETLVRNNERLAIGGSRQKLVERDEHAVISGERRELISGALHLTIKGDRRELVEGAHSSTIDGDRNEDAGGRHAIAAGGEIHIQSGKQIVLEGPDITLKAGGGFIRITSGGVFIDGPVVLIQKGGAPSDGSGCNPTPPEPPTIHAGYVPSAPVKARRLPLLSIRPIVPFNIGPDIEQLMICSWICECDKFFKDGRRASQNCLRQKGRLYDAAHGGQSRIKTEVPYDMSKNPPTPIMSKNHPGPTTGSPKGSKIPDLVLVHDGANPPTQDNIRKVIEVKFGDDNFDYDHRKEYKKIAGNAPLEEWTPDHPCMCNLKEPIPEKEKVKAEDVALAVALIVLAAIILADDAMPGGQLDDPLLGPIMQKLMELLSKLPPVIPLPAPVP
jgi:type VI secretion system secreted protein VgrG